MRFFNAAAALLMMSSLVCFSTSTMAATAHNSQAGSYGPDSNPNDSTPASPRVKHAAKHKAVKKM